ncbi:MAG: ATP-NAD kinase family protein [Halioglobus sp.]
MTGQLHLGLIINPLAGLGGSLALKGSDGQAMRQRLHTLSAQQRNRARDRVERALRPLQDRLGDLQLTTWSAAMGANLMSDLGIEAVVPAAGVPAAGDPAAGVPAAGDSLSDSLYDTAAEDTRCAAMALKQEGVDLLIFAGGDGTARDIYDAVGADFPVLGIPCGVKMHSGVFAVSPEAAGELLAQLVSGGLVGLRRQEVRDIDEQAFRADKVRTKYYGEMLVPSEGRYLQQTKIGGKESPELVATDIAAWMAESMDPQSLYLIGPGSTTASIMQELALPNTLLGVDAVRAGVIVAADVDEQGLLELLAVHAGKAEIVVTAIGGQGHIFGRGNQQFSPAVIRAVGVGNIIIVAAKSKISELEGRPLLVDTNDPELDLNLAGYRSVLTGYDDHILYRVGSG